MSATISPKSPAAWMLSFALHALIVGVLLLFTYTAKLNEEQPRILELVAGPGEDYAAMAAPAFGTEAGVKFDLPEPAPAPPPIVPAPAPPPRVETSPPIVPAPPVVKKTPPKPKEVDPAKDIAAQIKKNVQSAKRKAEAQAARDRKKELDRIKKEQARMTKEQFDRQEAAKKVASSKTTKSSAAKSTATKFKPIDTKGIRDGVVGGSSASTKGAGGKALTRAEATLLELYDAEFLQKLRRAFEEDRPPGLSDSLRVTIGVTSNANGSLTNARVTDPSGSPEFDQAVLAALRRVKMPPRPVRKSEPISFVFTMREE